LAPSTKDVGLRSFGIGLVWPESYAMIRCPVILSGELSGEPLP
jgi:hypothetical protein